MHPKKTTFTKHAAQRLRERGFNHLRLTQQLNVRPYEEGHHRWDVPNTNLFIAYADRNDERIVITVSFRYIPDSK